MTAKPSWQTDELDEEWIDEDSEQADEPLQASTSRDAHTTSDISFTEPLKSVIVSEDGSGGRLSRSSSSAGTVVVHSDEEEIPILPKTPGRAKKLATNDLFSPLALEKMFEPPSPPSAAPPLPLPPPRTSAPAVPSRLSQMYIPGETDSSADLDETAGSLPGDTAGLPPSEQSQSGEEQQYLFTFAAPRSGTSLTPSPLLKAQGTPLYPQTPMPSANGMSHAPLTDPRLRLFQFQYDTFTREHLSAMVDTIAVNTPSGGGGISASEESTPASSAQDERSLSRLRSAKRLKLSPASDFSPQGDGAAHIIRPQSRRDYVAESTNLMEKIRQARDFSTISTQGITATAGGQKDASGATQHNADHDAPLLAVPNSRIPSEGSSAWTATSSQRAGYSSLAIREQAASLMNQIRSDVKSHKRLFSVDSDGSMIRNEMPALAAVQQPSDQEHVTEGDTEIIAQIGIESEPIGRRLPSLLSTMASSQSTARPTPHDDTDHQLAERVARVSLDGDRASVPSGADVPASAPQASTLAAGHEGAGEARPTLLSPLDAAGPAHPAGSLRAGRKEDLARFVSSSTASGGTLGSGSAASFVKHQGPRHMTHISPSDLPPLPDRVGRMVFDHQIMRWVKATASTARMDVSESEDPFRDFESLRDDDTATVPPPPHEEDEHEVDMSLDASRAEPAQDSGPEDAEEAALTSFSFDASAAPASQTPPGSADSSHDAGADSGDGASPETSGRLSAINIAENSFDAPHAASRELQREPALADTPPHLLAAHGTDAVTPRAAPAPTPLRSALKSGSATPVSTVRGRLATPAHRIGHRRSVSFSDGKHEGPIAGLGRNVPTPDPDASALSDDSAAEEGGEGEMQASSALVPSARSKRIAEMLDGLEETSYDDDSPSRANAAPSTAELQPLGSRRRGGGSGRRSASRSGSRQNATFLTECSFGVAHDRLVAVITDVQPFEPYWEQLAGIDLSGRGLDSVARLKEFLPRLDSLNLNHNQIAWLSGVPGTVRTLSIASNGLSAVTSFSHLLNLESLDISRNNVDSLRQLECLRHLRELRADGNAVASLDGLQKMDGLVKLSVQGNALAGTLDLSCFRWSRLEMLNLSQNGLAAVVGLSSLPALAALNLDNNALTELGVDGVVPRLRILRLSGNRLQELNAAPFPNLRTLYADNNALGPVHKAHRLTRLENLSLRNQGGRSTLALSLHDVRDAKRLYLSGNPLKPGWLVDPCYNLVYLELAACRLTHLPANLARLAPNLRNLNLNYNFLDDVRPLEGLVRLRRLTLIGSRVQHTRQLVRVLRGMLDIEMLDFRMNPCTLGYYLPLLVRDVPGALQPADGERPTLPRRGRSADASTSAMQSLGTALPYSQGKRRRSLSPASGARRDEPPAAHPAGHPADPHARDPEKAGWKELDAKFRRDLPDGAYAARLAYRGLVMRACPAIRLLDGVEVGEKEREKAERLLRSVFDAPGARPARGGGEARAQRAERAGRAQAQGRGS
ncbi:hypothetical protein PsYK624_079580 [Phanerochaete sordida]|uniref:L domain-like protein n=1 Tax=Phanerochaete sordida TaxID=48140 RepID=A0A9P3G9N1_9APHY|nr:hypothetical protein PsYK624_079580 [Phanerochaete sordida]